MSGLISVEEFKNIRELFRSENKKIVFTNGCFDLIHAGHIDYLSKAKLLGDFLVVGLNTDESVTRIKGDKRPILKQDERVFILSGLKPVDYILLFNEDTPAKLISNIIPDVLVKGADWAIDKIVGKDIVEQNGGEVKTIKFTTNQSTSKIIQLIIDRYTK